MLRAPFDQTTTEGTAWSSTMEEPSPIHSLSSQPLALPAPQCQDAHAPALLSRTITRKLKIIIIIATLNHCPKWSNQPLLLHMRTKELMRQMGSPSSSQIQPMEISGIPHSEDDTKSPLCAATSSCNKAEINASILYLSKSTMVKWHFLEPPPSSHIVISHKTDVRQKKQKKPTCAFFFVSRKLYQSLQT